MKCAKMVLSMGWKSDRAPSLTFEPVFRANPGKSGQVRATPEFDTIQKLQVPNAHARSHATFAASARSTSLGRVARVFSQEVAAAITEVTVKTAPAPVTRPRAPRLRRPLIVPIIPLLCRPLVPLAPLHCCVAPILEYRDGRGFPRAPNPIAATWALQPHSVTTRRQGGLGGWNASRTQRLQHEAAQAGGRDCEAGGRTGSEALGWSWAETRGPLRPGPWGRARAQDSPSPIMASPPTANGERVAASCGCDPSRWGSLPSVASLYA